MASNRCVDCKRFVSDKIVRCNNCWERRAKHVAATEAADRQMLASDAAMNDEMARERQATERINRALTEAAEERVRTDPEARPMLIHPIPVQPEWSAEQMQAKIAEYKAQIQRRIERGETFPEGCCVISPADAPECTEDAFIPDPPSLWARFCGWLRRAWWHICSGPDF